MIQIKLQLYKKYFEVLPDELESTEVTVEHAVSHVLLELFGEVSVDDVTIRFSSDLYMGLQQCAIQIHAQCSYQSFTFLPRTQENIEHTVAKCICPILKELFGSVHVDSVTVSPFSIESQKRFSFPSYGIKMLYIFSKSGKTASGMYPGISRRYNLHPPL